MADCGGQWACLSASVFMFLVTIYAYLYTFYLRRKIHQINRDLVRSEVDLEDGKQVLAALLAQLFAYIEQTAPSVAEQADPAQATFVSRDAAPSDEGPSDRNVTSS
ncbi:hypothetical protein MPTK1_8g02060 [Marchantia polymorpha subsp. ruderalis]|nr:hypothetical protein Mp_8g02060 [Marchantia polymorpha subsp. ruderalis]